MSWLDDLSEMEEISIIAGTVLVIIIAMVMYVVDWWMSMSSISLIKAFLSNKRIRRFQSADSRYKQPVFLNTKISIKDYLAKNIRQKHKIKAYRNFLNKSSCQFLVRIKPDRFCNIRSVIFQMLIGGHHIKIRWFSKTKLLKTLRNLHNKNQNLMAYNFLSPFSVEKKNNLWAMIEVVEIAWAIFDDACSLSSNLDRLNWLKNFFKLSPVVDWILLDAALILIHIQNAIKNLHSSNVEVKHDRSPSGPDSVTSTVSTDYSLLAQAMGVNISQFILKKKPRPYFEFVGFCYLLSAYFGVTLVSENLPDNCNIIFMDCSANLFMPFKAY